MTDFPEGAIKSKAEFEALIAKAKQLKARIPIYPVMVNSGPAVILPSRAITKFSFLDRHINYSDEDSSISPNCYLLLTDLFDPDNPKFAFENWWLAQAYVWRLNKNLTRPSKFGT